MYCSAFLSLFTYVKATVATSPSGYVSPRNPKAETNELSCFSTEEEKEILSRNFDIGVKKEPKTCAVTIDHVLSVQKDPYVPHCFVSVILFLLSTVIASNVQLHVAADQIRLVYNYDRPPPSRDSARFCRAWTIPPSNGFSPKFESYHPFVHGFASYVRQFRNLEEHVIKSQVTVVRGTNITVKLNIPDAMLLKLTTENTSAIPVNFLHTTVSSYKESTAMAKEIDA